MFADQRANYSVNRAWADKMTPHVNRIVGPYLLETTPDQVDMKEGSDLWVIGGRDKRIAVRVRRAGYAERYPFDFTVRSAVPSGVTTELEKLVNGFGDWMFYGHASVDETSISHWMLIDLAAWRAHLIRWALKRKNPNDRLWTAQSNDDGTKFAAFDVRNFVGPPAILIASSAYESNKRQHDILDLGADA